MLEKDAGPAVKGSLSGFFPQGRDAFEGVEKSAGFWIDIGIQFENMFPYRKYRPGRSADSG